MPPVQTRTTRTKLVSKDKKKVRFNIVDLLIVIAVLLGLSVFAYYIFLGGESAFTNNRDVEIEYTVRICDLRAELANEVAKNDPVIDAERFYSIGKVYAVRNEKSLSPTGKYSGGKMVYTNSEDHVNMYVTIRTSAKKTESGYSIGGYSLFIGKNVCVRTPGFTNGTGYCVGINEVDS